MDAGRLLEVLEALRDSLQQQELAPRLDALGNALDALQGNPTDSGARQQLTKALEAVRTSSGPRTPLESSQVFARTATSLGLGEITPHAIGQRVERAFSTVAIVASEVRQQLNDMRAEIKSGFQRITQLIDAMKAVGILVPARSPDRYEVGLLLPTTSFKGDLVELREQLDDWILLIRTVQEVSSGRVSEIPISGVSEGSLELFLTLDLEGAKALLLLMGGVLYALREKMKYQKTRERLEQDDMPQEAIDLIADKERSVFEIKIDERAVEITAEFEGHFDANRRTELEGLLKLGMRHVAAVIKAGGELDVIPPKLETGVSVADSQGRKWELPPSVSDVEQIREQVQGIRGQIEAGSLENLELPSRHDHVNGETPPAVEDAPR
ncbi:MAG: hypothetical protein IT431_02355 [Phycisphaerales bacterium]|nr:hypothetical protein [Phycisphaerales bacterium]